MRCDHLKGRRFYEVCDSILNAGGTSSDEEKDFTRAKQTSATCNEGDRTGPVDGRCDVQLLTYKGEKLHNGIDQALGRMLQLVEQQTKGCSDELCLEGWDLPNCHM